jgi:hypothetical protein
VVPTVLPKLAVSNRTFQARALMRNPVRARRSKHYLARACKPQPRPRRSSRPPGRKVWFWWQSRDRVDRCGPVHEHRRGRGGPSPPGAAVGKEAEHRQVIPVSRVPFSVCLGVRPGSNARDQAWVELLLVSTPTRCNAEKSRWAMLEQSARSVTVQPQAIV